MVFVLCFLIYFFKRIVFWSSLLGSMIWLKTCWFTWVFRVVRGSFSRYIAVFRYTVRVRFSRCFWFLERCMFCGYERGIGIRVYGCWVKSVRRGLRLFFSVKYSLLRLCFGVTF